MLVTMKIKSSGMPRNLRVRVSWVWSTEGKAWLKSKYAMRRSMSCVGAPSMHRLRCVMAREQKQPTRKASYSGLGILCAST
jgi:hypothetical protein